jgi:hypothetical protein
MVVANAVPGVGPEAAGEPVEGREAGDDREGRREEAEGVHLDCSTAFSDRLFDGTSFTHERSSGKVRFDGQITDQF